MAVDRRTFIIVAIILIIAIPIIIIVFRKSFFPLLLSVRDVFVRQASLSGSTGLPAWMGGQLK